MKFRNASRAGFTLLEIMIVVAIVGLLATIATPTWVHARTTSQTNSCINNLRQIEGAKQQWALETKQASGAPVTYADISPYLKNAVSCPAASTDSTFGGSYDPVDLATPTLCRIAPTTHIIPIQPGN